MTCRAEGCTSLAVYKTKQLCKIHYDRLRDRGDFNAPLKSFRGTVSEKMAHFRQVPEDLTACFGWAGRININGYSEVWISSPAHRGFRSGHRVAYELANGPIPDGAQIDHVCHNEDLTCVGGSTCLHRRCTNPAHLRIASRKENVSAARRAERPGFLSRNANAQKTHCKWGHEFSPENTWMNKGARYCRVCLRRRDNEARERKRKLSS